MRDQSWFDSVAGAAAVVVVVVGVVVLAIAPPAAAPTRTTSAGTPGPTAYRTLSISYNPSTGGYGYGAAQLSVPQGVRVVFTITNYDPSNAALPDRVDAHVTGTLDGAMTVSTAAGSVTTNGLPPGEVSHTFSMSNGFYHVNIPIPAAAGPGAPSQVTFALFFVFTGTYSWGCVVLCGGADMIAPDTMSGSLTVG